MNRTKIVCTIGPACANLETLKEMMLEGMDVARFNMSHGNHETHRKLMNLVKQARFELGLPVAIMLDTRGPEIRIKQFKNGKIDRGDYCIEHTCVNDDCRKKKDSGSDYCFTCKCDGAGCNNGPMDGYDHCSECKCNKKGCDNEKGHGSYYCNTHQCDDSRCKNGKVDRGDYCEDHTCAKKGCYKKKGSKSEYCSSHD